VTSPLKLSAAPPHGDPETGTAPLAIALEERVSRLWWLVSRDAPSVVSRSAAGTLARLRESGPQRVSALAAGESVSQPTMTCLVQRLERDALVTRDGDPDDARASRISITAAGRHALEARAGLRAEVLGQRFERLDATQRAALAAALPALDALLGDDDARVA
jgi:DNA-binding MarR family transcriptional regulator